MTEFPLLPRCARCGHEADAHRLDDSLNLDPTDPGTPFRCLGSATRLGGCRTNCPDYVTDPRSYQDRHGLWSEVRPTEPRLANEQEVA